MYQAHSYVVGNEKLKLWLYPESKSFKLHSLEDEWDDWPYPHKMEYYIEGFLKEIGKVNSLQSLIRVCPIHCNQDQITSFIYKTLVEDDLFYAQSEEVFHISSELKISDSLVKITQQSQNGGPYGVRNSNHSYECKVFQPYALTIQALDDALKVTWPRFYKKWEKTSDGSEIYQGLVTFTSICRPIPI
jgi:hypothetical protein